MTTGVAGRQKSGVVGISMVHWIRFKVRTPVSDLGEGSTLTSSQVPVAFVAVERFVDMDLLGRPNLDSGILISSS